MKKLSLLIIATLAFIGCNQQSTESTNTYDSESSDISFEYPFDWEIEENTNGFAISVISPTSEIAGNNMVVRIPAASFEEYEIANKEQLEIDGETGFGAMSVEETSPLDNDTYTAKKYGQHGWIYYLVEVDEIYVGVGSEVDLTEEWKEGLELILSTISS
jgi:hypothetical protein